MEDSSCRQPWGNSEDRCDRCGRLIDLETEAVAFVFDKPYYPDDPPIAEQLCHICMESK